MARSIALDKGRVGHYVELQDGERWRITAREVLGDSLRPKSGITQFFYQLYDPGNVDRYLEVTTRGKVVTEVRLTTEAAPPDRHVELGQMLNILYEGKVLPFAFGGVGDLSIDGKPEGQVSWSRFYSAGQHEPGTKVVTVAEDVNGVKTYYGGDILDMNAVRIVRS